MEETEVEETTVGGIPHKFDQTVTLQKKAITGAMKMVYWLTKNEVAHFTELAQIKHLSVGGNASYSSHRMVGEWLDNNVEDDVLKGVRACPAVGLMCDKSTDISNPKE